MCDRVRVWTGPRTGKADAVGVVVDGPRFFPSLDGPMRWIRVRIDGESYGRWLSETCVECELPNGAGVKVPA